MSISKITISPEGCPLCLHPFAKLPVYIFPRSHTIHFSCLPKWRLSTDGERDRCPTCRARAAKNSLLDVNQIDDVTEEFSFDDGGEVSVALLRFLPKSDAPWRLDSVMNGPVIGWVDE